VAERQILYDTINVGRSEERRLSQSPPALGILALKQVASSGASEHDLARSSDLEPLGYCLPGFNAFGASHKSSLF